MFDDPLKPKKKKKSKDDILGSNFDIGIGTKKPQKPKREPVTKSQKNEVLAIQKNKCAKCNKQLDMRATHFDHIKEVYKGGKSVISNLQALCANCHSIKTNKDKLKKAEEKKSKTTNNKNNTSKSPFDLGL